MHVIRHASDGDGLHAVVLQDAAEVAPEPVLLVPGDQRKAVLGAKDDVHMKAVKGMGHGGCRPSGAPPSYNPRSQPFRAGLFSTGPAGLSQSGLTY